MKWWRPGRPAGDPEPLCLPLTVKTGAEATADITGTVFNTSQIGGETGHPLIRRVDGMHPDSVIPAAAGD